MSALHFSVSLIRPTLKARTIVPDQCKDDDIGRGMDLCRQSLILSPRTTSGQEMQQVYSYNPGAHTGTGLLSENNERSLGNKAQTLDGCHKQTCTVKLLIQAAGFYWNK